VPLIPKENEQIGIKHGESLAAWCAGVATPAKVESKPAAKSTATLKKELWELTQSRHGGVVEKLEQYLHDELYMLDDMRLADLSENQLRNIITAIKEKTT
jgi:hypothetical protein